MPKFSVIIPLYKVEEYIERCIFSLQSQTFDDFEAIFIDDFCCDNSLNIVKEFAEIDSRFKIIEHEKNLGTGLSRNDGINASEGEYICFLDPDDWIENNYFESLNEACINNPDVNWILFKYKEEFDRKLNVLRFSVPPSYFSHSSGIESITPYNLFEYTMFCWAKAYKRKWIIENEIKYPKETFEETPFYIQCVLESPQIYLLNKTLYHYTIRPNSWTTNEDISEVKKNIQSLDYLKTFIPELFEKRNYDRKFLKPITDMLSRFYESQLRKETKILNSK